MLARAYGGGCHCGAISLMFETAADPAELPTRECQCSFCRRHGARTTSDPKGHLTIAAKNGALVRYRFASRSADFLVCSHCGVYVAAMIEEGGTARATLNVLALDDARSFSGAANAVTYDGETADAKTQRRLSLWTPAELRIQS